MKINNDAVEALKNAFSSNTQINSDYVMCPHCGKELYKTIYCSDCGKFINVKK